MSDAPSKSNAEIDKPRRGIGRFLWYNAVATTLGCIALALTFDQSTCSTRSRSAA